MAYEESVNMPGGSGDVGEVFEVVVYGQGREVNGEKFGLVVGVFANVCMFSHPCGRGAKARDSGTGSRAWIMQR